MLKNDKLVKDRKYGTLGLKKISKAFYGSEAVTYFCEAYQARRNVAISLGETMMAKGFFEPVDSVSLPFADTSFLYSFKPSRARQTVQVNPIDNVVVLLQQLKHDEDVARRYDTSRINEALAFLSNKSLANNNLQNQANDLLGLNKLDTHTQAIVLAHTQGSPAVSSLSSDKKATIKHSSKKSIENFSDLFRFPSKEKATSPRGDRHSQEELHNEESVVRERSASFLIRKTRAFDQISDPILKLFAQSSDWEFDIFEFARLAGGKFSREFRKPAFLDIFQSSFFV